MDEPKRGAGEAVEGTLIAVLGGPLIYGLFAIPGTISAAPAVVFVGLALGFATFAYGCARAARGARIYLRNVETAALVSLHGADAVAELDAQPTS